MTAQRTLANTQRAAILAREQHMAGAIHVAHARMRAAIRPHVDALIHALRDARASGEPVNVTWLLREHRMSGVLGPIREQVGAFGTTAQQIVEHGQRTAAHAGAADAGASLADAWAPMAARAGVPVEDLIRTFARVPVEALDALVGRAAYNGQSLDKLFKGFGEEAMNKVQSILYVGVGLGDSPLDIASLLAGALNISRNRAYTIAATEMMGAYRDATMLRYRANADVCTGWTWLAAAGACPICVDLDGSQHDLSEDFDGAHTRCRCTATPLTRSYADILGAAGMDASGRDDAGVA